MIMKYFDLSKNFSILYNAQKYVLFLFIIVLSIGLTEALILSPEDYKQSHSVRIMYVHVPAAWISIGIFSSIAFLSISIFVFKNKIFDYLNSNHDCDFEIGPLEQLTKENQLMVYHHQGDWACMDTYRDSVSLNNLWNKGQAFWKS